MSSRRVLKNKVFSIFFVVFVFCLILTVLYGRGRMEFISRQSAVGKRDSAVQLYSAWYCPYAQRAWIALAFKNVDFGWVECSLYEGSPSSKRALTIEEKEARTPGFTRISPRGLVPALFHNGHGVCDSIPLVEYIEEAFPTATGGSLLPQHDVVERARIRTGISLFNELVIRRFYALLMTPSEESAAALLKGYQEMASYFAPQGFFSSSHGFSMFEVSCLPWYQRTLSVLRTYRDFVLPDDTCPSCARLSHWYHACLAVPAFADTIVDEAELIANYAGYADNSAANNCSALMGGKRAT